MRTSLRSLEQEFYQLTDDLTQDGLLTGPHRHMLFRLDGGCALDVGFLEDPNAYKNVAEAASISIYAPVTTGEDGLGVSSYEVLEVHSGHSFGGAHWKQHEADKFRTLAKLTGSGWHVPTFLMDDYLANKTVAEHKERIDRLTAAGLLGNITAQNEISAIRDPREDPDITTSGMVHIADDNREGFGDLLAHDLNTQKLERQPYYPRRRHIKFKLRLLSGVSPDQAVDRQFT